MAAKRKPAEPDQNLVTFTLGGAVISLPVDPQGSVERTEAVARRALHEVADNGSVEFNFAPVVEPEPETEPEQE